MTKTLLETFVLLKKNQITARLRERKLLNILLYDWHLPETTSEIAPSITEINLKDLRKRQNHNMWYSLVKITVVLFTSTIKSVIRGTERANLAASANMKSPQYFAAFGYTNNCIVSYAGAIDQVKSLQKFTAPTNFKKCTGANSLAE